MATVNAPVDPALEQQFLAKLKEILERAYRDGIDRFLSWDATDEAITGQFQDGSKVFEFTLSEGELDYAPSKTGKKQVLDSLRRDYPQLRDRPDQYVEEYALVRLDAKKRNCTGATSYACGETCINDERRCKVNSNAVIDDPTKVKGLINIGKQIKSGGGAGAIAPRKSPIPEMSGALGKTGAILAGAALLGVPVGTYMAFRNNYRQGFEESARQAAETAKTMKVDELDDDTSNVTIAVGGFAGDGKGGERLKTALEGLGVEGHHFVPVGNEGFDIRTPEEEAQGVDRSASGGNPVTDDWTMRAFQTFTRSALQQGRNPVAVRAAAQAYAYHQKYPDRPITLVGHSAGGISVRESAEILEQMGVKAKVVAIGSPYFGLTEPTDDTVTIGSRQDVVLKNTGYNTMNGVWMNDVTGHSIEEYFGNEGFQEFLKTSLTPRRRRDSLRLDKGKKCGKGYISEGRKCRVGQGASTPARQSTTPRRQTTSAEKKELAKLDPAVRNGVIAGASLLGIGVGAFLVQKARFEAGFAQSAEIAKEQAMGYEVPTTLRSGFRATGAKDETADAPDVKSQFGDGEPDQISFFVGGFGGVTGKEGDYVGEEFAAMFPNHHTVGVESPEFDITPKEGDRVYKPSFLMRAAKTVVGDAIKDGRNPVAVRIAARAYAYHQRFPDKPINLIGQSGGGMPSREAAEILERMGVKDVRVVATASPYFGLTKARGMTLITRDDPFEKIAGFTMPNKTYVNSVKGHSLYYVKEGAGGAKVRASDRRNGKATEPNPEVQRVLQNYFDRSRQDAVDTFDVDDLARSVTKLVNSVYTDGIKRLYFLGVNAKDEVVGRFSAAAGVFDLILNGRSLEYEPASSDGFLPETAIRNDKKQCTGATSYPCGDTCINDDKVCRVGQAKLPKGVQLQRFVDKAAFSIRMKGIAIAPPPKGQDTSLKTPLLFLLPLVPVVTTALSTSIALGMGSAAYLALRAKYRSGINESANVVKQMAEQVKPQDIGDKSHVTFTTGGFAGDGKGGERLRNDLANPRMGLDGHHFVPIGNKEFDINEYIEGKGAGDVARFVKASASTLARTVLKRGHNPVARDIAAQAYAYKQKYPNATISLVGHSGGGIASHEAAEILDRLGVKTQVVAIGSPYFEFIKPTEKSITFASPNDPVTNGIAVMNARWMKDVPGHDTSEYFSSPQMVSQMRAFLGGTRAVRRRDALDSTQKLFLRQLRTLLRRSYTDGIDQFIDIQIDEDGNISGQFRDGSKFVDFSVDNNIETKLAKQRRKDSEGVKWDSWRSDRSRRKTGVRRAKKKNCGPTSLSCRYSCIEATRVCRIASKDIATKEELSALKETAKQVRSPKGKGGGKDPLDDMSIRDLKKEASKRGVYRYSYMNAEELKRAIKAADENPEQQDRVRKTLERKKAQREAVEGTKAAKYVKAWDQIQRIVGLSGIKPELAIASVASILIGVGIKTYQDIRQQYRSGLKESAESAKARAEKLEVPRVRQGNITFAVGGFAGDGSTGTKLKEKLEESDEWFQKSNKVIAFDNDNFDIPPTDIPKKNADGSYNLAYLGYVGTQGLGAAFGNLYKQRNEASVELASQIYAYANAVRYDKATGKTISIHDDKAINVLAHGAGGMTAREAMDIIAEMPEGRRVLQRINLVSLGSPDFGMTDRTLDREMTITSPQDPWSILPARKEKRVASVKGHEIEDYLSNGDAISEIARFFGKGRTSTYYEEKRAEKARRAATREATRIKFRANKRKPKDNDEEKQDSYLAGMALVLRK